MHPVWVVSVLAGPFTYYLLPIFVPWVPVFRLIEYVFIIFVYPIDMPRMQQRSIEPEI